MNPATNSRGDGKSMLFLAILSAVTLPLASCATRTQEGAVIGGLGGAALGAAVADDAGEGALIGGAAGAVTGGLIGHAQDRRYGPRYRR